MGVVRFTPDFSPFSIEEVQNRIENLEHKRNVNSINRESLDHDKKDSKLEFIFIFDRSGSMSGDRITNLKEAAKNLINNLP